MEKFLGPLTSLMAIIAFAFVTGCGVSVEPAPSDTPTQSKQHSDDHDHSGHDHSGHDHSGHDHSDHDHSGHDHSGHDHGAGPHDGTLADWGGGKYHVELTVDRGKKEVAVYVLGGDAKTPMPIAAEAIQLTIKDSMMQVELMAAAQEGDSEGSASRFVGNHESLAVVKEYAGTITGVIDGTPYSGDFKEEGVGLEFDCVSHDSLCAKVTGDSDLRTSSGGENPEAVPLSSSPAAQRFEASWRL